MLWMMHNNGIAAIGANFLLAVRKELWNPASKIRGKFLRQLESLSEHVITDCPSFEQNKQWHYKVKRLLCAICPYLTSLKSLWEIQKVGECIQAFNKMPYRWKRMESPPLSRTPATPCYLLSFGMPSSQRQSSDSVSNTGLMPPSRTQTPRSALFSCVLKRLLRMSAAAWRLGQQDFALLRKRGWRNPLVPALPQWSFPELGDIICQGTIFSDRSCKGAGS